MKVLLVKVNGCYAENENNRQVFIFNMIEKEIQDYVGKEYFK